MLLQLRITNYALIKEVTLDFNAGLTAITGETGSGKSILLGAFSLLLGERADARSIRDASAKCIVEATFDLTGLELASFFEQNDLDYEPQTTIRREIAPGGKSRAFVNDTPVQVSILRALGDSLVDVHSQHENSLIGHRSFQFEAVDSIADNAALLSQYRLLFKQHELHLAELERLETERQRSTQELDFVKFQLAEFEKADVVNLDIKSLEQELETLTHAEQIKAVLLQTVSLLDGDGSSVLQSLSQAKSALSKIASVNQELAGLLQRLESTYVELREWSRETEQLESTIQLDEKRVHWINEKLSAVYNLQHKYRLQTTEELVEFLRGLEQKVVVTDQYDIRIDQLKKELDKEEAELQKLAEELSSKRKKAAQTAEKEVHQLFKSLSLEHAVLKIELTPSSGLTSYGGDEIVFLFSANKGSKLLPIKQVASGGEMGRVMLAIKAAISKYKRLPVIVLDEIDQGISGEVSLRTGQVLSDMSSNIQLLVITHLPQIAGKAIHHLKVAKRVDSDQTTTYVKYLEGEERINELAEMLSGKTLTEAALANARELMTR